MKKIKLKSGDEFDILTKARKFYKLKAGEAKKIKRKYNKRFRQASKSLTNDEQLFYKAYYIVVGFNKLTPTERLSAYV